MSQESRDIIYIDVDDEITAVIDKVVSARNKLVALVLPKRAAVFQSVVNMKLLKRKSKEHGKNIVLVTTETSLLPLAGAVGLHVAKTLNSAPEIPEAPEETNQLVSADEDEPVSLDKEAAAAAISLGALANEPVGKLSGLDKPGDVETIELDNEALAAEGKNKEEETSKKVEKTKSDKHLKIPNFEKFRLLTFLIGGGIILLIVLLILLLKFLPSATIDIKTNAKTLPVSLTFNLSNTATSPDSSTDTVPAKQVSQSKTYTATVNTTGQQSAQPGTGSVTLTAYVCKKIGPNYPPPNTIPSGTTVAQGGFNYTIQSAVYFDNGNSGTDSNGCEEYPGNATDIVADSSGSGSNTSSAIFTVVNGPSQPSGTSVSGPGSASGGSNAQQVVAQADISNAQNQINTNANSEKSTLASLLEQQGYLPLNITFSTGSPTVSPNPAVGAVASSVTVTENITFTMEGVKSSDLNSLIDSVIHSQTSSSQGIINSGLSSASYSAGSSATNLNLQTTAVIGASINVSQLKHKLAGFKSAQVEAYLLNDPNITSVSVHFSPFYVSTVPGNAGRVTINISKPTSN